MSDDVGYPNDLVDALDRAWGRRCNGSAVFVCFPDHLDRLFPLQDSRRVLAKLFGIYGKTLDHAVEQLEHIIRRQIAEHERPIRPEFNFVNAWQKNLFPNHFFQS
jgi:hypothetical protein